MHPARGRISQSRLKNCFKYNAVILARHEQDLLGLLQLRCKPQKLMQIELPFERSQLLVLRECLLAGVLVLISITI